MSMRLSGHMNLPTLKKFFFAWMGRNKSFATIDRVQAALVHTIGFLHNVHPDFYDRENIKKEIKNFLVVPIGINDDVNVFSRKIWMRHGTQKIETRALVIEVPKEYRDIINEQLMKFKLDHCENMTYVPFSQMTDASYNATLKQIFLSQNVYLLRTKRRNIYRIGDPTSKFMTKDGNEVSFCEWIESIPYENKTFLDACVVGQTGTLHIIYDEAHGNIVQQLFGKRLKEYAREQFCETDLQKIFGGAKMRVGANKQKHSKRVSEYTEFLKNKFQGNTQDLETVMNSSGDATLTYAEASRSPPKRQRRMKLNSYRVSEDGPIIAKNPPQQMRMEMEQLSQDQVNINIVLTRLEKLEANANNSSLEPSKWETALNVRLKDYMHKFTGRFEAKLSALEQKTERNVRKSEKLILQKLSELQDLYTQSITNSFLFQMHHMNGKLDKYMTMFMSKLESTDTIERHRSAIVVGKGV